MSEPYYQEEGITIYHGDCRDILPHLEPVDLVLTDPPYGVGFQYESYIDNEDLFFSHVLPTIQTISTYKSLILFMSMKRLWDMPRPKTIMCWAKPGSVRVNPMGGFSEWEPILVYGDSRYYNDFKYLPDISNHLKEAVGHPCPKPIRLFLWLIKENQKHPNTILDPFMGSGTTLVAAQQLGRRAIGIEIERKYCDIAIERLRQTVLPLDNTRSHEYIKENKEQGELAYGTETFRGNKKENI
jgi:DNA modification methylase